jgi:hypothetical protein
VLVVEGVPPITQVEVLNVIPEGKLGEIAQLVIGPPELAGAIVGEIGVTS